MKPANMSTKQFVACLQELNTYLPKFPTVAPGAPAVNKLDDEIVNIMEFGVPRGWQRKMIDHDFDVTTTSVHDFIDFCDRMESISTADNGQTKIPVHKKTASFKKNAACNRP